MEAAWKLFLMTSPTLVRTASIIITLLTPPIRKNVSDTPALIRYHYSQLLIPHSETGT